MTTFEIELLRNSKKKGLAAVKKRVAGALRNPSFIDIRPDGVLFGELHRISFTIFSSEGRIEGVVTYKP